jgi:putative tricarboxylic transport membrane protein
MTRPDPTIPDPGDGGPAASSRTADLVVALCMLLLAAFVLQGTFFSGRSVIGVSAPAVFPVIVVVLLAGFAALLVVSALLRPPAAPAAPGAAGRVLAAFAITLLYASGIERIGYHFATLAFIPAMAWLGGERRWWLLLLAAVALTGGIALVFGRLLRVPLPPGSMFG